LIYLVSSKILPCFFYEGYLHTPGCPVSVRSKVHTKLLFSGFMPKVYKLHIQLSFRTSNPSVLQKDWHCVQKLLFSCVWGIFLLPADFPPSMTAIPSCDISSMQHCQVVNSILHTKKQGLSRISALVNFPIEFVFFLDHLW